MHHHRYAALLSCLGKNRLNNRSNSFFANSTMVVSIRNAAIVEAINTNSVTPMNIIKDVAPGKIGSVFLSGMRIIICTR